MHEELQTSATMSPEPDFAGTLTRVGAEVLATMFFDEALPAPCDHGWIPAAASVRVAAEGAHCGEFRLNVSHEVWRSIVPAFLGIEPEEVTEAQSIQVLLELANILCGSILSQLWPDSDLTLRAPEMVGPERPMEGALHECFHLTEGMLSISILMRGTD
jgi:hypothetical protein